MEKTGKRGGDSGNSVASHTGVAKAGSILGPRVKPCPPPGLIPWIAGSARPRRNTFFQPFKCNFIINQTHKYTYILNHNIQVRKFVSMDWTRLFEARQRNIDE